VPFEGASKNQPWRKEWTTALKADLSGIGVK